MSDIGANGAIVYLTPERNIRILGISQIAITSGTALTELGFATAISDTTLKEAVSENDYAGRTEITYDAYGRVSIVESAYGNKRLKQTISYISTAEDADISTITEEII
jgi:hypothetical protein